MCKNLWVQSVTLLKRKSIEGYRVIRTFGGMDYETQKFVNATRENRGREMKIVATNALGTASTQILLLLLSL